MITSTNFLQKTSPWTNPDFLTSFITSQPNIFGSGAIQNLSKATSALSKLIHLTIAEFDTVYPTELELAKDLMDAGLLHNARKCEKCSCKMALRNRKGTVEWRCRRSNKTDCSSKSIKAGSFFSESKLSLKQAMKFIIMWITECSGPQIELQLKLSKTTICDWRQFLRGICTRIVNSYPPIGGSGKVVEIGESVIQARKHAKVTTLNEEYILVLGGIERGTHRIWMHTVPNRTKETFNATIGKHVDKESTVITNMFPAFDDLGKMCNRHEMLNQSIESYRFTEDGLEVSTGLIENAWTRLKSNGSADNTLDSYLDEFVVRQWEGGQFFMTVLVEIQSCKTDYRN
uniref:DDE_Tnp_IS1595 domain-containing protein n=1 Tax=Caenorhabditis japonica TaxID=281687 RepID=A0A8R1DJY9_CAEJA